MYENIVKRFIDIVLASIGIILTSPLLLITILVMYVFNKGQIFFPQQRPGRNEQVFAIYKFKTMNDKVDEFGNFLPDEQRITPIGRFIRRYSIDELLQLINVVKGDMSLVGPRPLIVGYLALYNDFQRDRHKVRPGITGLAQVKGRDSLKWRKRFRYDIFYVENISFLLDLKILYWTIRDAFLAENFDDPQGTWPGN